MSNIEKSSGDRSLTPLRSAEFRDGYLRQYGVLKRLCSELKRLDVIPFNMNQETWISVISEIEREIEQAEEALNSDKHRPDGTRIHNILPRINEQRKRVKLQEIKRDELY